MSLAYLLCGVLIEKAVGGIMEEVYDEATGNRRCCGGNESRC